MTSTFWRKIKFLAMDREAAAHQRELASQPDWIEDIAEDAPGGDVDRRINMFGSLTVFSITLFVSGSILLFSCRSHGATFSSLTPLGPESRARGFDGQLDIIKPSQTQIRQAGIQFLLSALAQIESGNNPHAIGRHGERSEYQITPAVWRESARRLSRTAGLSNPVTPRAALIASYHLGVIRESLWIAWRREPTPYEIYCAWNAGISATKRGRLSKATKDAARRFANMVNSK